MKKPINISLTHILFLFLAVILTLGLFACADNTKDLSTTPSKSAEQPVMTPIVVTQIVERVIERTVVVDLQGTPLTMTIATPTPELALPTRLPALPTPAEVGQKGDFNKDDLGKLFEVWSLVEGEFYGDLPTDENLTDAIIAAAIEKLGDRFTLYYPPAIAKRVEDGFRGDFQGIGAYVDTNDEGYFYIVRPIPNTPAFAAGIKPKDIIIAVNDESVVGWTTDEVVAVVRGPKGEAVKLTIVRDGEPAPINISVVRDHIVVPVVESKTYSDGSIGYVQLSSFNQMATDQLTAAVKQHLDSGVKALILDLRDNGGGLLDQAVGVGDLFLPKGDFLIIRNSDGTEERLTTTDGQNAEQIPLVLLVNGNSASASEVISGAFKDRQRAVLIGSQTFGKGSVQSVHSLSDGSEFRVTRARFYSPGDHAIHGIGITPDIIFEHIPEMLADDNDLTLQRAIEYISEGK